MRTPRHMNALMDRGGKPTVRELLSSLIFSPVDGTIRLNGDRLVMQRAAVGQELRRQLMRTLGEAETRIFMIRLGYQLGRNDARFVRASWPKLDIGDAFTAGTRLHTFSGIVRVETIHNDFNFAKKHFSGEFHWHDSVEATECQTDDLHLRHPICWTQLGYASGYASEFFDTLIVYKEVSCAAEGHDHCRVIGKPAGVWGDDDPEVILFRGHIATNEPTKPIHEPSSLQATSTVKPQRGSSALDHVLLAPVVDALERLAAARLPVLISGAPGSGKKRAAAYLHTALGADGSGPIRLYCSGLGVDLLGQYLRPKAANRKKGATQGMILLDDIELLPADAQAYLAAYLGDTGTRESVAVAAATALGPRDLAQLKGFRPDLWLRFSVHPVCLAPLSERADDLSALAEAMVSAVAERLRIKRPNLAAGASAFLASLPLPGNLTELEALLTSVILMLPPGQAITTAMLQTAAQNITGADTTVALESGIDQWLDSALLAGAFQMTDFEARIYKRAVDRSKGNLASAARSLGLSRAQLAYRLDRTE